MHAVVRTYSGPGSKELVERVAQRRADVEAVIRGAPGLVSYTFIETADSDDSGTPRRRPS